MTQLNWYSAKEWQSNQRLTKWGFENPIHKLQSRVKITTDGEINKMANIKDTAKVTEDNSFKKIEDLETIDVNMEIMHDGKNTNKETGEDFEYSYITVEGGEVRVPKSVLLELKTQLESKPDIKTFKVIKKGEGKNSKYSVVILE